MTSLCSRRTRTARAPTPRAVEKATEFLVTFTLVVPPVLQALPLAPFMTVTITSLSPHPGQRPYRRSLTERRLVLLGA
jgi:hypothetical protein